MPRLPAFHPPSADEMRALWRQHHDDDIRRLLLEITHLRQVLAEVDGLRATIDRAWKDESRSQLVALEVLRRRMQEERTRLGIIGK